MRGKLAGALVAGVLALVVVAAAGADGPTPGVHRGHGDWWARVCALANVDIAACGVQVVTDSSGVPLAGSAPAATALGPSQFHTAYNLPTTAPSAQTIAIVDAYDDPNAEADLATYDGTYGLPACTTANGCFKKVSQTGSTTSLPATDGGWALEISLDVQTAHEICQSCKILLVEAKTASMANLGAAVNEAVKLGATVVSNSYGGGESLFESSQSSQYFNHPGVAIVASSGDSGYGPQFPAASQYVTAVGGTTLSLHADGTWAGETAWADGGSGCSGWIAKPSWQKDTGCSRRTIADVAADADPATGAAVYDSVPYNGTTGWYQVGGTSLAAPLIGAVYALAGNASSVTAGSYPYAHASALHDVTAGANGTCSPAYLCTAGAGFDGPTGLGTPNGTGAF